MPHFFMFEIPEMLHFPHFQNQNPRKRKVVWGSDSELNVKSFGVLKELELNQPVDTFYKARHQNTIRLVQ